MEMTILIGSLAAPMVLIAFVMNQLHKWKEDYLIYDAVNLIGSLLLVIYTFLIKSYSFLILNFVWLGVFCRDVVIDLKKN